MTRQRKNEGFITIEEAMCLITSLLLRGREIVPIPLSHDVRRRFIRRLVDRVTTKRLLKDPDFRLALFKVATEVGDLGIPYLRELQKILPRTCAEECYRQSMSVFTLEVTRSIHEGVDKAAASIERRLRVFSDKRLAAAAQSLRSRK